MTNKERILEALSAQPPGSGVCDDCLEAAAKVHPRQQVNQICHRLELEGVIRRQAGDCVLRHHTIAKELNFLKIGISTQMPVNTQPSTTPTLAKQTDALSQWLFDAGRFLDQLELHPDPREPFAARAARLKREGLVKPSLSSILQMLNTYRVQVVKERRPLDEDEWQLVSHGFNKFRSEQSGPTN